MIHEPTEEKAGEGACDDDAFAAELAAIDAVLERSSRALAGAVPPRAQDPLALVYDLDWDEGARLQQWLGVAEDTRALPPLLAAALAYDAWISIEPLQHRPWLGARVVSGLLRARGKARHHLPVSTSPCGGCRGSAGAPTTPPRDGSPSWRPSRSGPGRGLRTTIAGCLRAGCSNASCPGAENTRSCRH